jgi:hypothetical protein
LDGIVINIGQRQTGFGTHSYETSAEIQLGARVFISPNVVRVGQRAIG